MTNLTALPGGTELVGDYRIDRVLGAGGFGVTYLAEEIALSRLVTIKEYFPSDFAARLNGSDAGPRSQSCVSDYQWGLDRFIEEAQTLAKFNHPNIVTVYRYFRANNTAYMVLHFEEGQSVKTWLKTLGRAPRQKELDAILTPLLDALETVHKADFLHRDIAPDNIIIRKGGDPVLIDFGAARSDIAAHSKTKTVSALVKPGYSPYEQYAETSRQQGPWTDIYALAATLYHAVTGKRPPDSPSRMLKDDYVPARNVALSAYRGTFLDAIDRALVLSVDGRPQSVAAWRGPLLAPEPAKPGLFARVKDRTIRPNAAKEEVRSVPSVKTVVPPPPDAPGPKGQLLDFFDALKKPVAAAATDDRPPKATPAPAAPKPSRKVARAEKAEKAKPEAAAKVPKAKSRPRPAPDVARTRPFRRGLLTKVILAAGLAGVVFAYGERLPHFFAKPASRITTGALPASAEVRTIVEAHSFKAHDGTIEGVSFSGDGRLIATTGADKMLKIWDADTRALNGVLALANGPATSLAVRNNRAVTSHADGTTIIWDLDGKRQLYSFKRNEASVWAAAFAGSEDQVAAAGHDWTVALWQTSSQTTPVHLFEGHDNAVQALATEPTGHWLASGGADRTVKLWDLTTNELRRTYRNHSDFISALAFSADGAMLAAATLDGAIKLWSTTSSRLIRVLGNHNARVTSIAFSPSGEFMASAAEDGTVRVRGMKRTRSYWSMNSIDKPAKSLAFSPDGRTLATGGIDGTVTLWTLPEPRLAQR